MTNTEIDYDDADPFPTPAPKKRGRPKTTNPKTTAKPRWQISHYNADELIAALRELACVIQPDCAGNTAKELRVAAEILELIENKKG